MCDSDRTQDVLFVDNQRTFLVETHQLSVSVSCVGKPLTVVLQAQFQYVHDMLHYMLVSSLCASLDTVAGSVLLYQHCSNDIVLEFSYRVLVSFPFLAQLLEEVLLSFLSRL